jgi:hypothetical protein
MWGSVDHNNIFENFDELVSYLKDVNRVAYVNIRKWLFVDWDAVKNN